MAYRRTFHKKIRENNYTVQYYGNKIIFQINKINLRDRLKLMICVLFGIKVTLMNVRLNNCVLTGDKEEKSEGKE